MRIIILSALLLGAAASLLFMFNASRNQSSVVLELLFTFWVLSPFIGLLVVNRISKRWSARSRVTFYWMTIMLIAASLVIYSGIFNPAGTKAGFIFLIVPFMSWVILGIAMLIMRKMLK
jgi:hypothetical protein